MGISQILKEKNNVKEIAKMYPCVVCYDMIYNFVRNKKPRGFLKLKDEDGNTRFIRALYNQPFTEIALNTTEYQMQLPQNQVRLHGIIYNALFNIYVKYVKKSFDSVYLILPQMQHNTNKIVIDSSEYNNLPRQYRNLFVKYYHDNYVLNTNYTDMVLSYANKNKLKLEQLLKRAQGLIPCIYREPEPDIDLGGTLKIYEQPDFYPDLASAKWVSTEQLNTIRELHDIFVEISKITLPCLTLTEKKQKIRPNVIETKDSAHDLYNKYLKEQAQKNIVYHTKEKYTAVKQYIHKTTKFPSRIIRGKEVVRPKEIKSIIKRTKNTPNLLFPKGQQCKNAHSIILMELEKALKTYTK